MQNLFCDIYPKDQYTTDDAALFAYSYDNSRLSFKPQIVLFPTTEAQIAKTVLVCNKNKIPLTVRGRGTATTGAALPIKVGVVLSTEKMDKVIEFNPASKYIIVEPGITNQALQDICKQHNLFWGPNPSSLGFCSIGGNLACNSAGSRTLKYGAARDNTLALRFITGDGKIIISGKAVSKQSTGFDFVRLLIGSEGMLGIITQATLKLHYLPPSTKTILAVYQDTKSAAEAIISIMQQPNIPSAMEFMDQHSVALIKNEPGFKVANDSLILILEVDGDAQEIKHSAKQIKQAANNQGLLEFVVADTVEDEKKIWQARKALSPKLREIAPKKINEDVIVPIDKIARLLEKLNELSDKHKVKIVNFGHAGNGNIHVNLLVNPDDKNEMQRADKCLPEIFENVIKLGGSISGEHGIGLAKRDFLRLELEENNFELMRKVKKQFDPTGILNPGKLPE